MTAQHDLAVYQAAMQSDAKGGIKKLDDVHAMFRQFGKFTPQLQRALIEAFTDIETHGYSAEVSK